MLKLSPFAKLIVLLVCLLSVKLTFSQERLPELIVVESDTLVTVTEKQFNTILFGFSYIRSLENTSEIDSKRITKQDSIIDYLNEVLSLERLKTLEKDSINANLETVIKEYKKARRREKVKSTFAYIGLGILCGAEAGVITYLLIR